MHDLSGSPSPSSSFSILSLFLKTKISHAHSLILSLFLLCLSHADSPSTSLSSFHPSLFLSLCLCLSFSWSLCVCLFVSLSHRLHLSVFLFCLYVSGFLSFPHALSTCNSSEEWCSVPCGAQTSHKFSEGWIPPEYMKVLLPCRTTGLPVEGHPTITASPKIDIW